MIICQSQLDTDIGPLYLVASASALHGVFYRPQAVLFARPQSARLAVHTLLDAARQQIESYLAGRRRHFDLPLLAQGTPFQRRVWEALTRIPYGHTISYRDLAMQLGGQAYRAVGTANGRNPFSIIVPCHRVIASDGSLGGYAGGLPIKTRLLQIEGVHPFNQRSLRP